MQQDSFRTLVIGPSYMYANKTVSFREYQNYSIYKIKRTDARFGIS